MQVRADVGENRFDTGVPNGVEHGGAYVRGEHDLVIGSEPQRLQSQSNRDAALTDRQGVGDVETGPEGVRKPHRFWPPGHTPRHDATHRGCELSEAPLRDAPGNLVVHVRQPRVEPME